MLFRNMASLRGALAKSATCRLARRLPLHVSFGSERTCWTACAQTQLRAVTDGCW